MELPNQLLFEIILNLDREDIYKLAQTCQSIRNVITEDYFWKLRYQREGLYFIDVRGKDLLSRLNSYNKALKVKKRLQVRAQLSIRTCTLEEIRLVFVRKEEILAQLEEDCLYCLSLGNSNFAIEVRKQIEGNGFLLRHNLQSKVIRGTYGGVEMEELLWICYMLD